MDKKKVILLSIGIIGLAVAGFFIFQQFTGPPSNQGAVEGTAREENAEEPAPDEYQGGGRMEVPDGP